MLTKSSQPQTPIAQQYASPKAGSAIRARVFEVDRMVKMMRGVRVTNSLTLVSNI